MQRKTKSLDKETIQGYDCIRKNTLLVRSSYFLNRIGSTNNIKQKSNVRITNTYVYITINIF